jgi:CIC family chloride channel protein
LTIGSGGSGGIFAPSLFIGAALGAGVGALLNQIWPEIVGPIGAYALVGMGAVFAAAAHAPITAVLILFELSDDYRIILPLMLTAGIATILSHQWMKGESIYTLKLSRRGIRLHFGRDVDIMESVRVDEVMNINPVTVSPNLAVSALTDLFLQTNSHAFPILDGDKRLIGMVSLSDYRHASQHPRVQKDLRAIDIASRAPVVAYPDETVRAALRRMAPRDLSRLPVVSREDPTKLLGIVRRNDIIKAYERGSARRSQATTPKLPESTSARLVEFIIEPGSLSIDKTLVEIPFPKDCVVVSIVRDDKVIIPHGDTKLEAGDTVTLLLDKGKPSDLAQIFREPTAEGEN